MAEPLRHRQTKEAATDMLSLQPPRHIPTLPNRRHHSMILSSLESDTPYERLRGGGRNTVRFAAASNAVSPDKALLGLHKRIPEILVTTVALLHSAVLELRKCRSNLPLL